jgi:hypothetical protein
MTGLRDYDLADFHDYIDILGKLSKP